MNGISGRDIAVIMENNKSNIFNNVTKESFKYDIAEDRELSEKEYWNNSIKNMCINEFTLRTGKKTRRENKITTDKEYNFIIGNIDRKIVGENSILIFENSNMIPQSNNDLSIDSIFYLMCQHNLRVYNAEKCYFLLFINYQKMIIKEIIKNEEIISMLIKIEKHFWKTYKRMK